MTLTVGPWQLEPVHGGDFSIDGGAGFGVVPKSVWQTVWPCDANNLVRFTCRCLLARNGDTNVLIDTGYGGKHPAIDRKAYQMENGNPLLESLAAKGIAPNDVDCILFTHLHFDHAGGATVFDTKGRLVPAFPKAKYMAQVWEWEDAISRRPELVAAYPADNLFPLQEHGCIDTFRSGEQLFPGLMAIRTGGHTRGHTAFLFQSASTPEGAHEGVLFIGDLCPTAAHTRMLWNMSYDTFLLETRRIKRYWLEQAANNRWWLLFPHDPRMAYCQIERHPKKEFVVTAMTRNEFPTNQQKHTPFP